MHDIMQGIVVVEERTSSSEMRKKWVCKTDALTCLLIPSLLVSCSLSLSLTRTAIESPHPFSSAVSDIPDGGPKSRVRQLTSILPPPHAYFSFLIEDPSPHGSRGQS